MRANSIRKKWKEKEYERTLYGLRINYGCINIFVARIGL